MNYRIEKDSLGQVKIEKNKYYGINTKRALENFEHKGKKLNLEIIKSMAIVKMAAAIANKKINKLDKKMADFIIESCEEIYSGKYNTEFPLYAIQGGAGTSINMNINEVIANIILEKMGYEKGRYDIVNPIEHINLSQSTNDVFPTAVKISVIRILRELINEVMKLQEILQEKETEFSNVFKIGRTQFQDAVPMSVGSEFSAYAEAVSRDRWRLYKIEERIRRINIGGTAIGTGVGASLKYRYYVSEELKRLTGYGLARAENLIDATQNMDVFVEVSSLLKTLAVNLNKMAKDLRILSSGPNAGLNEINLPKLQIGSSIMPGKINPVGPEFIQQIYFKIIGNDLTLTMACADGELELNAFTPIIAESILESIELLRDGIKVFAEKVVKGITVNKETCRKYVESSLTKATELIDKFGYEFLSEILKESNKTGKHYLDILKEKKLI
ncbi:aspartate ammonia-lyase [Hypnocyclicus thermotrophus]|uniref:Aspartate ammonia-lyase n=1 Tax=Hypnocyclicus thermotrophus TaxID=1627895 RepID=A0AA46DZI4_9FUSO|nr:aspartate ammonia-lyase [Hypnocyclicus thermotrophus]TDT71857.1 aspartate ammonia-lyase [Hypnocyclicus thermotrophus]